MDTIRKTVRSVERMTTGQLLALDDRYAAAGDLTDEELANWRQVESELERRDYWYSDDDRVRESVGNYGDQQ